MTSKQDVLLLKKKIVSARTLLMQKHPFFGLLLMHMRYIAVPEMEQISTNGESIFFSPEWMKRYNQNEVCSLLCHQMMHILRGDIYRPLLSKGDEFHYTCDQKVNEDLRSCGVGAYYVYVRAIPDKKTEDDWFNFDKQSHRQMVDTDEFWDYDLYDIENGIVILEASEDIWSHWGIRRGNRSQQQQLWAKTAGEYGQHGTGGVMSLLKRRKHRNKKSGRLDWRKLLTDFIQEETFDYSFCPPDRRTDDIGFFLPDFNEKDYIVQDVLFMVDTSGSISDDDLEDAYGEINHAINLFNGKLRGMLGFFDADVFEPLPFASTDDVARIVSYGGGGTDFRPIFEYMTKQYASHLPACLIIYTDGEGFYPEASAAMGVPVLWLVNNNYVTPPFGKVARVIRNPFEDLESS